MPGTLVCDRVELAAELGRRVGLHVQRVDRAQPAVQEDEDQRHVVLVANFAGGRLRRQQTRQRQLWPNSPAKPDLEHVAPQQPSQ